MRIAATGIAMLLLAACGSEQSGTIATEDGDVSYELDQDGDGASLEITGPDGELVSMTSGSGGNMELPPGFTVYPGAEVLSNTTISQNDGEGILMSLTSEDSVDELIAHYRKQAEDAGVEISMEMKNGDVQMIGGQSPAGLTFSFTSAPEEDGANGQLMIGLDLGG